ncbi:serine hydroxymethyltransferase, partial [Mycoplasmopsis synoviae]
MLLINVKSSYNITGKEAENFLEKINITINKNSIPFDELPPLVTSGIRLGTAAMTSRNFTKW